MWCSWKYSNISDISPGRPIKSDSNNEIYQTVYQYQRYVCQLRPISHYYHLTWKHNLTACNNPLRGLMSGIFQNLKHMPNRWDKLSTLTAYSTHWCLNEHQVIMVTYSNHSELHKSLMPPMMTLGQKSCRNVT